MMVDALESIRVAADPPEGGIHNLGGATASLPVNHENFYHEEHEGHEVKNGV
jgi:hypothetical protein